MRHPLARCLVLLLAFTSTQALACGPEALGTARTLTVGTGAGGAIGLKSYPRTLPLAAGEVVLTFDDGPLPGRTDAVLDALKAECVRATFFLIGRNAAEAPDLARRIARDGHTVAHHSFSHPVMRTLPFEKAVKNITDGFRAVDTAAFGSSAGVPRVAFFRFPGFADTPELNDWLMRQGIVVFGADVWASDWEQRSAGTELRRLMARLKRAGGGIVLLHDIQPQTAAMVPALLRALKAGGYRIVHVVPGPGRLEARAAAAGWTSETESILRRMGQ